MTQHSGERTPSEELALDVNGIGLRAVPLPAGLEDMATFGEMYGTSETMRGIQGRARVALQDGAVNSFIAVGRPEKVIAQAALLEPASVTLLDISDQNMIDGLLLLNALRRGQDVRQAFAADYEQLTAAMMRLTAFSGQGVRYGSFERHLDNLQAYLDSSLVGVGVSAETARRVIGRANSIRLLRADIKGPQALAYIAEQAAMGPTILDAANIPLPELAHQPSLGGMRVFSALNIPENDIEAMGIWQAGQAGLGRNTVWHYGREHFFPKLPVAYSPDANAYQELLPLVNRRGPGW